MIAFWLIFSERKQVCYEFKKAQDLTDDQLKQLSSEEKCSEEELNKSTCTDYCTDFSTPGTIDAEKDKHYHEQLCNHESTEKNSKIIELVGTILVAVGLVIFVIIQFFDANKCFRLIPAFVCFIGALLCAVTTILLQTSNSTFESESKKDIRYPENISMKFEYVYFF